MANNHYDLLAADPRGKAILDAPVELLDLESLPRELRRSLDVHARRPQVRTIGDLLRRKLSADEAWALQDLTEAMLNNLVAFPEQPASAPPSSLPRSRAGATANAAPCSPA